MDSKTADLKTADLKTAYPKTVANARYVAAWKSWIRTAVPALITIGAVVIAWHYLQPAPPSRVIIAAGPKNGVYFAMAQKYAQYFAENGITLDVRETAGSAENFQLLTTPRSKADGSDSANNSEVDVAIVQGGSSPPAKEIPHLRAVAGTYYEPVLVFTKGAQLATRLSQLTGKKIAIGVDGSGVRVLALTLLAEAGLAEAGLVDTGFAGESAGTSFVKLGGDAAADALSKGEIDAAFFVIAPTAPVVARLLKTPDVHLMSFDQAHAYGRRHPFLSATTLYEGAVDIEHDLPGADTQLIASPATIVVRDSTHSAVIELLVRAAQEFNGGTTLLSEAGTFPTADRSEIAVSKDARYFLKTQPGFLRRTLPFWLASMIDRLVILVVPLLVVLIPLVRTMPQVLKWRVQRRIYNRYKQIRRIEEKLHADSSREEWQAGHDELVAMDKSLATFKIPISFVEELYNLRTNVTYVRGQVEMRLKQDGSASGR